MTVREKGLMVLTVIGFLVPNTMLAVFVAEHGPGPAGYLIHWFESLPAAQLAFDVTLAAIAFSVWAIWEGRRLGMRTWWLPIPASVLVGVCFAVPLFLLLRERALVKQTPRAALAHVGDFNVSPGGNAKHKERRT